MSQIVDELRAVATQIETETQVGGNTAARVGGAFNKVADCLDGTQQIADLDAAVAAVQQAAQENEQTIQDIVNSLAVVQTTGQSTSDVMSQKAVTDEIDILSSTLYDDEQIGDIIVTQGGPTNSWVISEPTKVYAGDKIKVVFNGSISKYTGLANAKAYLALRLNPINGEERYIYLCGTSAGTLSADIVDYIATLTSRTLYYTIDEDAELLVYHRISTSSHFEAKIYKENDNLVLEDTISFQWIKGVYLAYNGKYEGISNARVTNILYPLHNGQVLKVVLNTNYKHNIAYFTKYGEFVKTESSAWLTESEFYIEWDGLIAINVSYLNGTTLIDPATFASNITLRLYEKKSVESQLQVIDEQLLSFSVSEQPHPYWGERINLQTQTFNLTKVLSLTAPTSETRMQSLAIYGENIIIGRHTEVTGGTSFLLYKGNTYIQELVLPHTGYSAIHANTSCFGESSSYTLPLLYTSQWDGERACFVYEFDDSFTPTLKRVIDPVNLSSTIFGAGAADWIVGDGFLYSIAYILDSPYPAEGNGLRVCKFALPTGSGVINLADSDVIEYYDISPCFVRQDSFYHNGKIYTLFGGDTVYQELRRMQVLDTCQKKVVTICDMQFTTTEPEAISMLNDSLVMMYNNIDAGVFKFVL